MNLLHLYLSYSPWSAICLSNKETEDIPLNILGKSRVFDIGVAYTFSFISFLPVSVKAGYINMSNHQGDIYAYHFPANKFNYFYYGLNISLGAWNTGGLHVRDKYTIVPFIANSGKALRYRAKMQKDWNSIQRNGSIEAYEKFLRDYPHEDLSPKAHEKLDQLYEQRDWRIAKSANTISELKQFVAQYPQGQFTGKAQELISCILQGR
jgi:outer membrane protein assembly factor BamD (BamD/ComL family)